jgi:hypothetical protein
MAAYRRWPNRVRRSWRFCDRHKPSHLQPAPHGSRCYLCDHRHSLAAALQSVGANPLAALAGFHYLCSTLNILEAATTLFKTPYAERGSSQGEESC